VANLESQTMRQAIVFDGDDTLWQTEYLYDQARAKARAIVEDAGLDGTRWEDMERRIDVENVARLGHSVARFPTSCVEAYESLCVAAGRDIDPEVSAKIGAAARAVFNERAPVLPEVRGTLAALRRRGLRLALLTKGDPALQERRVEQSGLAQFFDLVQVVDQKTPESITAILDRLGVTADCAVTVGNSVRSDVLPSLAAGVQPIWIDAHVWEYEREHPVVDRREVIELDDVSGLLGIL
jgi:putative hydrolase of the HAD superfamily